MKRGYFWLLLLCMLLIAGCATVQPWEREYLADPIMSMEDDGTTGFHQEIEEIREASALGKEGDGGGCGCN
ncbi:DUF4266 domain-containing protein [candidate division CSSED10-310 bacterium]|uniref:DUF4266 domain-containing protein n=1 Tax=candidate division CSSED10-310 bacterium TaxID=2855610 RepID=A0ABV6Z3B0_UNCC1